MREAAFVRCTRCEGHPLVVVMHDSDEDEGLEARFDDADVEVENDPDWKAVYFRCRGCDKPIVALKNYDDE
ncbi:MAG: hypothetical protein ACREBZ_02820 [Thermoplasmata archaeon]